MPTFELYDILNIPTNATEHQIKRAYRKQALKWHPDLHPDNVEEATEKFKEISNAYSILSDPHERRWYDEHGDEDTLNDQEWNEEPADFVSDSDLKQYQRSSAFRSYDDSDSNGFYNVFDELFRKLDSQEALYCSLHDRGKATKMPRFGDSNTPYDAVKKFYRDWKHFHTIISFAWKDKWRLDKNDPQYNSWVRRQVEKENRAQRREAKMHFNAQIKSLVQWLKQRDRRILQEEERLKKEQKRLKKEKEEQAKIDAELLKEIKANEEKDYGEGVELIDDDIQDDLMAYFDEKKKKKKGKKGKKGKKQAPPVPDFDETLEADLLGDEEEDTFASQQFEIPSLDELRKEEASDDDDDTVATTMSEQQLEQVILEDAELELTTMAPSSKKRKKNRRRKNKMQMPPPMPNPTPDSLADDEANSEIIMQTQKKSKKSRRKNKKNKMQLPAESEDVDNNNDDASHKSVSTSEADMEQPQLSKKEARKLKRQKRKEKKEKSQTQCKACGESFSSRSKLFDHLKSSGHAVFK